MSRIILSLVPVNVSQGVMSARSVFPTLSVSRGLYVIGYLGPVSRFVRLFGYAVSVWPILSLRHG